MYKMKSNTILPLIMQLRSIRSPLNLRKKLLTSVRHGWSWIGTLCLKPLYWRDPSSSFSYRSSDSLETQGCAQQVPTSHEMSRPMSLPTHLYAKRSVLNLTKPSTILDALRSRGAFSPSKGKVITSISQGTSGLRVQILCTQEARLKG